jgi:hypothetical protein
MVFPLWKSSWNWTVESSEDPIEKQTINASVAGFLFVETRSLLDDSAMNAISAY